MVAEPRMKLVAFDRQHLGPTRAWVNDPKLSALLDRVRPVTETEHEAWYQSIVLKQDCIFFAIELENGMHVGNVWLWNIDSRHRKAEVRILIGDSEARNVGIGTESIKQVTSYAFWRLNLNKVYAYVLECNPRAKASFEKAGFAVEGLLQADRWTEKGYSNVVLLGRVRS